VAAQDYLQTHIAVLDDGSKDGSFDVITSCFDTIEIQEEFQVGGTINGKAVMCLRTETPSGGPSQARNILINAIQEFTHIFGMLDADDEYLPGKISMSVAKMLTDPETIGLVYSDTLIHRLEDNTLIYEARQPFDRTVLERENIISNAPLVSKVALQTVGVYDEELRTCEDWDLWLRITEKFLAIHIAEPLQVYKVTGENATFVVNEEMWNRNWHTVQTKLRQRNAT